MFTETHNQIVKVGGLAVIIHSLKMDNRNLRNVAAIVLRSLAKMNDGTIIDFEKKG